MTPSNPTSLQVWSLISTILAVILGAYQGIRALRPKEKDIAQQGAAILMTSYETFLRTQREEMDRLRLDHAEREKEWKKEKRELEERIDELQGQMTALMVQFSRKEGEERRKNPWPPPSQETSS